MCDLFTEHNIRTLTFLVISVPFIRFVMYFRLEGICGLNENGPQRPIKSVRRRGLDEVGVALLEEVCDGSEL